ncbi:MAG: FmdB family transcriptional regulator [Chloroflexi bacterium]|nr:FmdB family transcriptional regulator [Chloroflexota bacterium]
MCGYRHGSRHSRLLIPPTPEHLLPIYTYKCEANGHEFELRQGFSASPEQVCPTCGSTSRRQIHAPTVIYKGSGFYTTDYARKSSDSSKANASSSDGASSDGASSDGASSDGASSDGASSDGKSSGESKSSSKKDGASSSSKKDASTAPSKSTADS